MKVSELIALLQKCSQDSDVTVAYNADNPREGDDLSDVIEIHFRKDDLPGTVVLRS